LAPIRWVSDLRISLRKLFDEFERPVERHPAAVGHAENVTTRLDSGSIQPGTHQAQPWRQEVRFTTASCAATPG
jgi:hypothetical protein